MAKSKVSSSFFSEDSSYTNVYFLKIDASGHSNIVLNNSSDKINKFFDIFEQTIREAISKNQQIANCQYAEGWGWQGDGGLFVFYDKSESFTQRAIVESAINIIDDKLPELKKTFDKLKIKGTFHIRSSIHCGSFLYKGDLLRGSIHSKELNYVSHLEAVTPIDSITMTEDVYQKCENEYIDRFVALNYPFEGQKVYIYSPSHVAPIQFDWLNKVAFHESFKINTFPERLSEHEKATFIKNARFEVVDLGTAAKTCSYYLETTQRPAHFSKIVYSMLESGINYTCLLLNPDSEVARVYGSFRDEDIIANIKESLARLATFAKKTKGLKGKFSVMLYSQLPYFASIAVDPFNGGAMVFSPYFPRTQAFRIERADSPHFFVSSTHHPSLFKQLSQVIGYLQTDKATITCKFE